jgi:molybdate transport system regulatory protein
LETAKVQVCSKIWIEVHGRPVLGPGRLELLQAVKQQGSISKAAHLLKMTYRKAWGQIKAMEERMGLPLLVKQTGGTGGGGASLTPQATNLLAKYHRLIAGMEEQVNRRFQEIFYDHR